MSPLFSQIDGELGQLANAVAAVAPDERAFNLAHQNWTFPGVGKRDLLTEIGRLRKAVVDRSPDQDVGTESLGEFPQRIAFLRVHTVPQLWGNSQAAMPAIMATLWALDRALEPHLRPILDSESAARMAQEMRSVEQRLKGLESRLNLAAPRVESLEAMLQRIEDAHATANQLPADLEALADARKQLTKTLNNTDLQATHIAKTYAEVEESSQKLTDANEHARKVLERCEAALKGSTSVGLGAAFADHASVLKNSMGIWTVILILALGAGGAAAYVRGDAVLAKLNDPNASTAIIVANVIALLLTVGGPVWLAWLASKQVGYRFRLAEDYVYKASISRAYEGYSAEALRVDKALEAKLLASALDRLDELPLRVVDPKTHGSPVHELFTSPSVTQALKSVPNFLESIQDMAKKALEKSKSAASDKPDGETKSSA